MEHFSNDCPIGYIKYSIYFPNDTDHVVEKRSVIDVTCDVSSMDDILKKRVFAETDLSPAFSPPYFFDGVAFMGDTEARLSRVSSLLF